MGPDRAAIVTYAADGSAATDGVGSYCIKVTSASTKDFYYNSKTGGLDSTLTACPATNP